MTEGGKNTASTIILSVLMAGALVGVVIGLSLDSPDDKRPEKQIDLTIRQQLKKPPEAFEVPVRVDRSERALQDYRYQEDRAFVPEVVDEDLFQDLSQESDQLLAPEISGNGGVDVKPGEETLRDVVIPNPALDTEQEQTAQIPEIPDIAMAPAPEVIEESLPPGNSSDDKVEQSQMDQPEWQRQARALPDLVTEKRPLLSIVIDDVGIDQKRTAKSIQLDGPLTFSFIPYGRNLQVFADEARKRGHEIMLHLPMEPQNPGVDPGPNAMLTVLEAEELSRRLKWSLEQFDGYVGLNNHMGSKFTAWEPGMALVLEEVRKRRIYFMDSVTSPKTVGFKLARDMGVDVAIRDVFLDHVQEIPAIQKQLARLEQIALRKGHAIAIGHPHDKTTAALADWLENVEERGFRLVPVSGIIYRNMQLKISEKRS